MWAKVLDSKYGSWRSLDESRRNSRDSIWWRDLSNVCNAFEEGSWFRSGIKWKIGCGSKVKFWEDGWLDGGILLLEKYPRMYSISQQQHHFVQQLGVASLGGWDWQLQWRRLLREAEIDIAAKFMKDIEGVVVQANQQDSWGWGVDPSGIYSVGSAYKALNRHLSKENDNEVFKELWKLKVPSKVSPFAWRLIRDRLPTKANLRRRNVDLNDISLPFL